MAEAEIQIAALRKGTEGTITIAGPPVIMTELLPETLVRIAQERPRLQVRVISQNKGLFTELLDGKSSLVIAMLYNEIPKQGLATHWLFDDPPCARDAAGPIRMAKRRKFKPRDLLDQKWIFGEDDNWSQQRLKLYFEQHGLALPRGSDRDHEINGSHQIASSCESDRIPACSRGSGIEAGNREGCLNASRSDHR